MTSQINEAKQQDHLQKIAKYLDPIGSPDLGIEMTIHDSRNGAILAYALNKTNVNESQNLGFKFIAGEKYHIYHVPVMGENDVVALKATRTSSGALGEPADLISAIDPVATEFVIPANTAPGTYPISYSVGQREAKVLVEVTAPLPQGALSSAKIRSVGPQNGTDKFQVVWSQHGDNNLISIVNDTDLLGAAADICFDLFDAQGNPSPENTMVTMQAGYPGSGISNAGVRFQSTYRRVQIASGQTVPSGQCFTIACGAPGLAVDAHNPIFLFNSEGTRIQPGNAWVKCVDSATLSEVPSFEDFIKSKGK